MELQNFKTKITTIRIFRGIISAIGISKFSCFFVELERSNIFDIANFFEYNYYNEIF